MRPSPASVLYHPLDEVLGTRASVRVLRVLAAHGGHLAVGEIAQRARLTLPSVRSAIQTLLQLGVVTVIGAGRSSLSALSTEHPLVPVLHQLFRAEQGQAAALLAAVRKAAARLEPAPWAVWLFGSVARGEDSAGSDIDIALIAPAAQLLAQTDALRSAVSRSRVGGADRVAVIALAPADVKRAAREKTPFWLELSRDAVVLFGDGPAEVLARARRAKGG